MSILDNLSDPSEISAAYFFEALRRIIEKETHRLLDQDGKNAKKELINLLKEEATNFSDVFIKCLQDVSLDWLREKISQREENEETTVSSS